MAKITLATFKSFLKKNEGKLLIKTKSSFDPMIDCVRYDHDAQFEPLKKAQYTHENNFGYAGVWCVGSSGSSRNTFMYYENEKVKGIEVRNCVGSFIVAVPV